MLNVIDSTTLLWIFNNLKLSLFLRLPAYQNLSYLKS